MVGRHTASCYLELFHYHGTACPQVCHELVVMEKIQMEPEFSPAASLEALTKRPLRLH